MKLSVIWGFGRNGLACSVFGEAVNFGYKNTFGTAIRLHKFSENLRGNCVIWTE
jgi:hypothetical protein